MGSKKALSVFNSIQPLLMESLFLEGYSVCLKDFFVPKTVSEDLQSTIQDVSPLLHHLRSTYNELVELQIDNHLRSAKVPFVNFILKLSGLGNLIDSKSESSINKVVQQIGFIGLQLSDRGKFYSKHLVEDMTSLFLTKYAVNGVEYPSEAFGLIKSCFFQGLNPYEELVHSISSREVLVRSSRGLTEPGTLFKNLMAILRDVVICYDGTVRNLCSNSIIQFEYGVEAGTNLQTFYPAGEPVGVLAATAISNPAYKAVLDSSQSSNASWELMKEILLCKVNFMNDINDRRIILYLNDCGCGKNYCKENAAYLVRNRLKRVSLKDIAINFIIEYQKQRISPESQGTNAALIGHIHLDKKRLKDMGLSMHGVLLKCQETINGFRRKKKSKAGGFLKNIFLSVSERCCFQQSCDSEWSQFPCLQFSWPLDTSGFSLEITSQIMANMICPPLFDTIIKGDPRVYSANIIWINPDTTAWVKSHCRTQHGELALEIVLEKGFIKQHGDAWRLALDSCLPVIHLIDTTRSIPYAIRQVQETLGISCAFDQAVQRLSTSIRMVKKGVLKEHLILAANSMTCTGNLIGFNRGGYKALFRSLNVQIPFTESTLFTPRKCFERAAEKCHMDSLSSIVASCSWGKHVAVGTGTRFELLWNKKEMGLKQDDVRDVYNFLQLVRMTSNGGELNTACLGDDDLEFENGDMERSLSPEPNSDYPKPTFDDSTEVQWNLEQNQTDDKEKSGASNWEKDTSWVKSGGSRERKDDQQWNSKDDVTGMSKPRAWDDGGADKFQTQVSQSRKPLEGVPGTGWDTKESEKWPSKEPADAWGKQTEESDTNGWNKVVRSQSVQSNDSNASHSTKPSEESPKFGGWNVMESQQWSSQETSKTEPCDTWGKKAEETETTAWNKSDKHIQRVQAKESRGWDANSTQEQVHQPASRLGWGSSSSRDWTKNENTQDGQERELQFKSQTWGTNTIEEQVSQAENSHAWGSSNGGNQSGNEVQTQWSQQKEFPKSNAWDTNMSREQGKKPSGPRGWGSSNSGDWKLKKSRPAKSPGNDWNAGGVFTATRQRFDQFTSEEQKILSVVEPIMQSIRRIMQQCSNNDGDPLSPDDQSYVLDNVFNYHPDKAVKMGLGVNYITVSKHSSFQDSRCFYVVSTDGRREDFSYRKCLENFIKEKYPEMAVSFISKYFKRQHSGAGNDREQAPA